MKKIIWGFFSVLVFAAILLFTISPVKAMTEAERQSMINAIMAQIAQLQAQISQMVTSGTGSWCYTFNTNLKHGNTGNDVAQLQTALNAQGFPVAASEQQSQIYGASTSLQVSAFQVKYTSDILTPAKLSQPTGIAGLNTRKKLNALYACGICHANWQCDSWTPCSNLKQSRSCVDLNNCKDTKSKPLTSQACVCTPNWQCTEGPCANLQQKRDCVDLNNCGNNLNKPASTHACLCQPNWQCTSWSQCTNLKQSRSCTDTNNCGITNGAPAQSQPCFCNPNWQCTDWGECKSGKQSRSCVDMNNCGVTSNKPLTSQSCL